MTAPPPTIAQILTEWHADKDAALRLADENCAAARSNTANGKSERPTREINDERSSRS
jgi:hypothetical protein